MRQASSCSANVNPTVIINSRHSAAASKTSSQHCSSEPGPVVDSKHTRPHAPQAAAFAGAPLDAISNDGPIFGAVFSNQLAQQLILLQQGRQQGWGKAASAAAGGGRPRCLNLHAAHLWGPRALLKVVF